MSHRDVRRAQPRPDLTVPEGPWCDDTWTVVEPAGDQRRGAATVQQCAVDGCDGDRYWLGGPTLGDQRRGLCYAHYFQWFRAGQPTDFTDWAATDAQPPRRPRGRTTTLVVDFRRLPATAADEIRFVVATKVRRGDWTCNTSLRRFLILLITTAESRITTSLTERRVDDWLLLCRQNWHYSSSFDRLCAPYIRRFFRLLDGATNPNLWAEDHWRWRDGFEFLLDAQQSGSTHTAVDWGTIALPWLRSAVKDLARRQLTTATLAWGTLTQWLRATRQFAQYLTGTGEEPSPPEVTRPVFLDYLAWARQPDTSADPRLANTAAYLLETLHDTGMITDLGSAVFLRRGENVHRKTRRPRPFPADVIERIDRLIVDNPNTEPTLRAMIATTRWAGCRISELVALPIDCLHHSDAGYWIEYWMPKTQAWRRFPIPDSLADIVRDQQARVQDTYGPDAEHLFPGARSNAAAGRTHPWSTSGLRHRLTALFTEHDITTSTITGENISGGDVHRFRHTVGMTLLNSGWTQPEVRDFLGHHSDTMTSTYARITDDTLAKKTREFWNTATTADDRPDTDPGVERLRARFTAALPNGFCTLPANQRCEFRPNPCLDCSFHNAGGRTFLGTHIAHRDELQRLATQADQRGDTAAAELNTTMLDKVSKIIDEIGTDEPETP